MIEITNAPMMAAVKFSTVKPWMILATNQKNAPLTMMENSPSVRIFNGSVSIVMIGFTTIFKNTKQAATSTAVKMLLTVMPATKNGNAKIANVVMNQRSNIMRKSIA